MFKGNKPLVYFAAPLFSDAELTFNHRITIELEKYVDVYLPQRDGGKLVDLLEKGVSIRRAYSSIFERDIEALNESDVLLIVLDGRSIDEGAVFELGFAFAKGKRCIGLQTDPRRLMPAGNNPMIQCALEKVFASTKDLEAWVRSLHSFV